MNANIPFAARLAAGEQHEQRVAEELRRGWTVDPRGQGTLSGARPRGRDSRLRYLPDLIAARGAELVTTDCKDRIRSADAGRYAINRRCVSVGLQLAARGVPVFYVFEPGRPAAGRRHVLQPAGPAGHRQRRLLPP